MYQVRNGQDEFNTFIKDEFSIQASGYINDDQLVSIGNALGAQLVCGIVVEYIAEEEDYYFRAKVISVANDEVKRTAKYPNEWEGDLKVSELSRFNLQKVALLLIKRLQILPEEGDSKLDSRIGQMQSQEGQRSEQKKADDNRRQTQQRKQTRAYNAQAFYESFLKPEKEGGMYIGYNGVGFEYGMDVSNKWLHLGFGAGLASRDLPICEPDPFSNMFSLSATIGLNSRFVGLDVSPHVYFNDSDKAELKSAFAITPEIFFNIPFEEHDLSLYGIRISIGYSLMPAYNYNPGFAFKIGSLHGF